MNKRERFLSVGVVSQGTTIWHAPPAGGAEHLTQCGIDAKDAVIERHRRVMDECRQKITCPACHGIWRDILALRLRVTDFVIREGT